MQSPSTLAPYATHAAQSRGRALPEPACPTRSVFQRDRDRIIHSTAFRRLEYKTQVFVNHEGDHYRTRLTHSMEVAQLTRSLCRGLGLDEDLGETVALAHDLGHTPFGHAGEEALQAAMAAHGGFDHNAQSLRLLTHLEARYAAFDGLNLTWESLEGIAKHNGPLTATPPSPVMAAVQEARDLELTTHAGLEAQIAALADDIAYHNHDLEDGIRAGIFTLEDLTSIPFIHDALEAVTQHHAHATGQRRVHEVVRRVIHAMVTDLMQQTQSHIRASGVAHVNDVRAYGQPLAAFSPVMAEAQTRLKAFLTTHMYRHYRVNRMTSKARRVVTALFTYFFQEPECLPPDWYAKLADSPPPAHARIVCDFIAGMTDRFALNLYGKLFDVWERP